MQRRVGLDVRLRDDILVPLPREEHRDAFFLVVCNRCSQATAIQGMSSPTLLAG